MPIWLSIKRIKQGGLFVVCLLGWASAITLAATADGDRDGLSDAYEVFFGLDPRDPADAQIDWDHDGLDTRKEFHYGTDPQVADTDRDRWADDKDRAPLSRAVVEWAYPHRWSPKIYRYPGPAWWLGARISGGDLVQNTWHVASSAPRKSKPRLLLEVDRSIEKKDLMINLEGVDHAGAVMKINLLDEQGAVVAGDLFGNIIRGSNEEVSRVFRLPLSAWRKAKTIELVRESGEVTLRKVVLYVDEDEDGFDEEQEIQRGTSDHLSNLLVAECAPGESGDTAFADPQGRASAPDFTGRITGQGGCGPFEVLQDPPPGQLVGIGDTRIAVYLEDPCGQREFCAYNFTVTDNAPPALICAFPPLTNPDFERGGGAGSRLIEGWTLFGNVYQERFHPRSGRLHSKLFGTFNGLSNYSGLFQDLPARAGENWVAGVYAFHPREDALQGANRAWAQLEFLDDQGRVIDQLESRRLDELSPRGEYIRLTVSGTAPVNTAWVRMVCVFNQSDDRFGAIYFDDAVLTRAVAPVDETCRAQMPDYAAAVIAEDNSGAVSLRQTPAAGTVVHPGEMPVTVSASDAAGNQTDCSFMVAVMADSGLESVCDDDADGLPNHWEITRRLNPNFFDDAGRDEEGDGVSNLDEYRHGSDPRKADTDDDGLPDDLEALDGAGDPLTAEPDRLRLAAKIDGAAAGATLGRWQSDSNGLTARDRRGFAEYTLPIAAADIYRIEIEAADAQLYDPSPTFYLRISIDGEETDTLRLQPSLQTDGIAATGFITPWMAAGPHTLRIFWDNVDGEQSLCIRRIRLWRLDGPDADANGRKDWVEARLHRQEGIDVTPSSSVVSPVCLEGRTRYFSKLTLPNGDTPHPGAGRCWYADVPLASTGATDIAVSFQAGGRTETRRIEWVPLDLLHADTLRIRVGDTLQLAVGDPAIPPAAAEISINEALQFSGQAGEPFSHTFSSAGVYHVRGSLLSGAAVSQTHTLTVTVMQGSFGPSPVGWSGKSRPWTVTDLPPEAVIEADPRIVFEQAAPDPATGARPIRFTLDDHRPRHVVARTEPGGPILASETLNGIRYNSGGEGYLKWIETLPDGSDRIQMLIVADPVLPDVDFHVEIFVAGVTFPDGGITRVFRAGDFNELGESVAEFIRAPGQTTGACNRGLAWQGPVLIGVH